MTTVPEPSVTETEPTTPVTAVTTAPQTDTQNPTDNPGDAVDHIKKPLDDFFRDDVKTKEKGLYTMNITAEYLNPITGMTADGGTQNVGLGQGMCMGVIAPVGTANETEEISGTVSDLLSDGSRRWAKAMLQRMGDGRLFVTIRVHMINWMERSDKQGPFVKVLQKDGSFKLAELEETKVHIEKYKDSYADYRFEVPHEDFLAMVQMYVIPMNRPVRYFVLGDTASIVAGNAADMNVKEDLSGNTNTYVYISIGVAIVVLAAYFVISRKKSKKRNPEDIK